MVWSKAFVYFGSAEFSRQILAGLVAAGNIPRLVVSTRAKPAGRGLVTQDTPVSSFATEAALPCITVESLKKGMPPELVRADCEIGLLAAFGKILPAELLALYPQGIINVHPSLLPLYRGPAPVQYALLDGLEQTGITLIKLDQEVDHGPVLAQKDMPITKADDALSLEKKLAELAIAMLLKNLPLYMSHNLALREQNHVQASFTSQITKTDGQADFSLPAVELDNKRRAFTPWPGLWTNWQQQRLKFINTRSYLNSILAIGTVGLIDGQVAVGCGQRTALILDQLQLAGGKVQTSEGFINGHLKFIGSHLPS